MASTFDIPNARSKFPALNQKQVFFDNAGGSQVLGDVIKSITDYLSTNNVQLGASYPVGAASTKHFSDGLVAGAQYINAENDEVVIGGSTTQLFRNLSIALKFSPGDELVVSKLDHEANIASWVAIAEEKNLTLKWWTVPPTSNPKLTPESLKPLLSSKTKLVTCTHASNILGTIHDIKSLADTVHTIPGAHFCVDGVAYAPHRRIDVKALGVDFYSFSWYKVYGPHVSMLYASRAAQDFVKPLSHYFNPTATLSDKLGLAASNYESTQTLPVILSYLGGPDLSAAVRINDAIASHEHDLQKILLDYLATKGDEITVFGETDANPAKRVPTVSFGVKGKNAREVVEAVEKVSDYGFRWGHFYSKRLCDEVLQLGPEGVIRVSMVHYNTEEEIKGFVETFDKVIFG
ncbi:Aminotransferase class V/Cysteine desulfurase [Botryosphaeria dothidea]|uniref:Aminotransferase class V/Cysteine desulfurase n=1 Tax=Botryosphaeria dothidea TaxID=55169 RepID=A0A8H4INM6_9PEZI|nr:Aminotransferase class V/Cysteine desulfurase [Botryosphaeria dothidea]KAF4305950.1 Aminotransferase class V/Cysteine desulfurase [Botryosphaeria dothidea]